MTLSGIMTQVSGKVQIHPFEREG